MTDAGKVTHVNSATLVMGVTGSGKSALLATLARYIWEVYHKVTIINSTDGGGIPTQLQALMQMGIVWLIRLRTRDLPDGSLSFETCYRATQGWIPKRVNRATGETFPGEPMVPPITEAYAMHCPLGHHIKTVPFQSLLTPTLCPTCKVMTDRSNMRVEKTSQPTKGFENVGAICFDGLTSMLSWMMSDMGQRAGRLELKGEEGAIGGKIQSGDMKFGGSTRSHFGFAQSRSEELVLNSLSIPGLMVPPVFTALTLETDDDADLRVRGPKLAGKAKTDEAGAWFGNSLETMVLKNDKDERIFRLQLSEFIDDNAVRHLCKIRAAPGTMPDYLEDPPLKAGTAGETSFTNFNLGVFFTLLDKARQATLDQATQQYPDAPGLPDGIAEVGESTRVQPAAAPITAAGVTPVPSPLRAHTPAAEVGKPSVAPSGTPKAPTPTPRPRPAQAKPATVAAPAAAAPAATVPTVVPDPVQVSTPAPASALPAATVSSPVAAPASSPAVAAPAAAPVARPAVSRAQYAPPGAPRPPAAAPRVGARPMSAATPAVPTATTK